MFEGNCESKRIQMKNNSGICRNEDGKKLFKMKKKSADKKAEETDCVVSNLIDV